MRVYLITLGFAVLALTFTDLIGLINDIKKLLQKKIRNLLKPSRTAKAQRAWPAVIDDITSAVRSGISMDQAFLGACNRAPNELRSLLHAAAKQLSSGNSLVSVLERMQESELDAVGRRLILSLQIAATAGGKEVVTTLQVLAESVRRDLSLLDSLRAKQKSAVTGARVAVFAPWLVIALTSVQPSVRNSYQTNLGLSLLAGVAAVSSLAYFWMLRIAKLRIGTMQ